MTVYVDTSALYAVLDRDDRNHEAARRLWHEIIDQNDAMVTTNYVIVETMALVQRRLGMQALSAFATDALPVVQVEWISQADHGAAMAAVIAAERRDLSFVDLASFQIMRRLGLRTAFAFDAHFGEQGFELRS